MLRGIELSTTYMNTETNPPLELPERIQSANTLILAGGRPTLDFGFIEQWDNTFLLLKGLNLWYFIMEAMEN